LNTAYALAIPVAFSLLKKKRQAAAVQKRQEAVPGIINPHAIADDMNDY